MSIYTLLGARLFYGLVAKTKTDAKGVQRLEQTIVVADQVNHFVFSFIEFQSFHHKNI